MEHGDLIQVHDDRREAVDILSEAPKSPNIRHPVQQTINSSRYNTSLAHAIRRTHQ